MARLPILEENLDFIRLDLSRHYIQIDCDFTCYLVLNPSGIVPLEGTDVCVFRIGAWQIDAWLFLTDKFTKNTPGFSACLCWDKTLITELALAPRVAESDIDTANSISSLKGQPVNITGFSMAEGESLPVASNDDSWISVKPFLQLDSENVDLFPVSSFYKRYAVGDVLDIGNIRKFCMNVSEIDHGYRLVPAQLNINSIHDSSIGIEFCSICKGVTNYGYVGSNATSGAGFGVFKDYFIDILVTEGNIITGFSMGDNITGACIYSNVAGLRYGEIFSMPIKAIQSVCIGC